MARRGERFRYPIAWRLLDGAERLAARVWPGRLRAATPYLLLAPAALLVALLAAGLVDVADTSFRVLDSDTFRMSTYYTLANYFEIVSQPIYWKVLGRSFLGASVVTLLALALAFPYAYTLVRTASPAVRKLLLVGLFVPFFLGQIVRAYGWLIVLGQDGLLNSLLAGLGLGQVEIIYTFAGVVVGLLQYMLPFAVLMLAPAMTAIPEDVELASQSLGAGTAATFRHVLLPMAAPGLLAAGVVVFTLSVTDFAMAAVLGGGTTDFIANTIYDRYFHTSQMGLGAALALLLVVLMSALLAALFRIFGTGTLGFVRDDGGDGPA